MRPHAVFFFSRVGGELRRGCCPPPKLFDAVSKQREVCWYLSARGPRRILCLKTDSLPLRCQTHRGQDSMEKKKKPNKTKHSALCSKEYWKLSLRLFGAPATTKRLLQLPLALPPSGFLLGWRVALNSEKAARSAALFLDAEV